MREVPVLKRIKEPGIGPPQKKKIKSSKAAMRNFLSGPSQSFQDEQLPKFKVETLFRGVKIQDMVRKNSKLKLGAFIFHFNRIMDSFALTDTQTRTYTHAHTHTHFHTNTRTLTQPFYSLSLSFSPLLSLLLSCCQRYAACFLCKICVVFI